MAKGQWKMRKLTRITYIEDDPDIRAVTEMVLENLGGFTLNVCSGGLAALQSAPLFKPDLILLDVMMPGMDGIEVLNKFQNMPELAATPVIFMTAKAQRHEVEGYKQLGAADVISKPYDPMTLVDRIVEIWNRHQAEKAA